MKKLLSILSIFALSIGITSNCISCKSNSNINSSFIKNFVPNNFTSENSIISKIKSNISTHYQIYNYGLNPLARIFSIKMDKPVYASITINAKNTNESSLTYYVDKTNLTSELVAPILFLYQNCNNKVDINLFSNTTDSKPIFTQSVNIKIGNIYNINNKILNAPTNGNYSFVPNYLFFTSGGSNPKNGKNKQPYLAFDKYGELRWLLPQESYDIPLEFENNNNTVDTILAPINFEDLYPNAHLSFYPFVESKDMEKIDWLGLTKSSYYDTSHYYTNHDFYNNGTSQIMIANREDFKKNNLPPNDAIIAIDNKTGKITQYNMDQAWESILTEKKPIWKTFGFTFNDWIHLNAISKVDSNNVLVSSRALNTIYDYNLQNNSISWLITSSDALYKLINQNSVKAILVNNKNDLFYGQHGLKFLSSKDSGNEINFLTLDNHYVTSTIEKYDTLSNPTWESSFKEISVNLATKSYTMLQNFKIDNTTYMGESNIITINNTQYAYLYTPDSGYITFYDISNKDSVIKFKKYFSPESYRITPYLFDNKLNINF